MGVSGDVSYTYKKVFEELLQVDVVRGQHSTGAAFIGRNGKCEISKEVGPAAYLINSKEYSQAMAGEKKAIIGHNRYATMGRRTAENAHPFEFDSIVGAHNGTVEWALKRKLHDHVKFDTDSEAIFSNINKFGIMATLDTLTENKWMDGAWALVWYDKNLGTINFARNPKRSLFYAYSEDECTIFWASELEMLKWILGRNGVKTKENKLYQFNENRWYSFKIPSTINGKFQRPRIVEHTPPPPKPIETYTFSPKDELDSFRGGSGYQHHNHHSNVFQLPFMAKKHDILDPAKFRQPYKRPNGLTLKKPQVEDMVAGGCLWCNKVPDNWKFGKFAYTLKEDLNGRAQFLCEHCYIDPEIRDVCQEIM